MPLDPMAAAQKWANNLGASTTSMRNGINAVTVAPTQKASDASATWQAKMTSQHTLDKWKKGLARVTLQDWKDAMLNKGLARISTGAQAALPKMQRFLTAFLPFERNIAATVRQMPKITIDDAVNRAAAQIRGNATFPGY